MPLVREEVPGALAGERLDRIVAMLTGVSRSDAGALVADGAARVDGEIVRKGAERVGEGALVEIDAPEVAAPAGPEPDPDVEVPVVFEDDDVVVVDKPAGLVVHPGAGQADGTLVSGLLARYPEMATVGELGRPGIVHRLDKGTSGLLMVARTARAYDGLVAQLAARSVERRYLTLVWGHLDTTHGLIDAPIGRSARQPTRMGVSTTGREARTRYEVLEAFDRPAPVSLLACRLETGRTHQIRVHLAAIGHPVVGDDRYRGTKPSISCPRPFLHAERLGFDHPATGEHLAFESALPGDLAAVLATLAHAPT
ncbi:MAG: rluD [Acidimicrobiales bacterium]|nr:rluD [Acidimicrobiales bacterium]